MSKYIKPKAGINVSGMSLNDILNMDFDTVERLSRNDLARITSRLASAGNKRINTLRKSSYKNYSQALNQFELRGSVKFSVKNKNRSKLLKEFSRVKRFMQAKTSTVKGTKATYDKTKKTFKERYKMDFDKMRSDNTARMWSLFHKLKEKGVASSVGSPIVLQILYELTDEQWASMTDEEIEQYIYEKASQWYEKMESEEEQYDFEYDEDNDYEDEEDFY